MLAGLGPLLGEDTLGGFASLDSLALWGYHKGTAWIGRPSQVDVRTPVTLDPLPVVAVLTDGRTASSGEAIVIAFRGRSRTRSFGQSTSGLSTGNTTFPLPGGSILFLTTVVDVDRTGRRYGGPIAPDEQTSEAGTLDSAIAWLTAATCGHPTRPKPAA
jgi:hypothetical protein